MSGKMQLSYAICKGNVPVGASAVAVRAVLAWSHSVHTVIQGAAVFAGQFGFLTAYLLAPLAGALLAVWLLGRFHHRKVLTSPVTLVPMPRTTSRLEVMPFCNSQGRRAGRPSPRWIRGHAMSGAARSRVPSWRGRSTAACRTPLPGRPPERQGTPRPSGPVTAGSLPCPPPR